MCTEVKFERDFVRFCKKPSSNMWFVYNFIGSADLFPDDDDQDQMGYLLSSLSDSMDEVDESGGNSCDKWGLLVSAFGVYTAVIEWYEFVREDKEREVEAIRKF